VGHEKENSDMIYFPYTNEYLFEARGGEGEISSNRYSNTCGRQRRGRREG
jgi:hypothetical protein